MRVDRLEGEVGRQDRCFSRRSPTGLVAAAAAAARTAAIGRKGRHVAAERKEEIRKFVLGQPRSVVKRGGR